MESNQDLNKMKFFIKATGKQRIISGVVFLVLASLFFVLLLMANGTLDPERLFDPCGFKMNYGLPCPACGMTTSAVSFVRGRIFEAFHIQPAGAFLCCVLVITGFLTFITAVFGLYFAFLKRFFAEVRIWNIILVLVIIVVCGWAVTLARAISSN